MKVGRVIVVCTSPVEGVPKYVQPEATIAEFGFEGDYHCRPLRPSFSQPGTFKPNTDRHISIVAKEALDAVNAKLELALQPGSLGENILTEGLGDLGDVVEGACIEIGSGIQLVVTAQNNPCINLRPYHHFLIRTIYGRRGLLCAIKQGVGRVVRAGDMIAIL